MVSDALSGSSATTMSEKSLGGTRYRKEEWDAKAFAGQPSRKIPLGWGFVGEYYANRHYRMTLSSEWLD